MSAKPTILVIGSPVGLVADETWANFTTNFNVKSYDFPTNDDFHESLRSGSCKNVDGIVRLGLNLPEGCEKVLIGWTHRGLAHFPPSLKVIVNFGHGYNDEAVDELREKGITFFNTTGGSQSTAAVGIYLIVAAFRNLSRYERMLRQDQFLPALRDSARNAVDPFGKSLGIIGMGSIGETIARQAATLGMKIHSIDRPSLRSRLESEGNSATGLPPIILHDNLLNLARVVDCVLLSCPYSAATHHLLCKEVFAEMKKGARIINIARGLCIDEEALCDAIEEGIVGGAGLDVHHDEPKVNPRLLGYDCVTLLPHVGGLTNDSMKNHAELALNHIVNYFSVESAGSGPVA
ncbi:hypothetical protein NCS57_00930500 [Fusarium keratoplasticum]|uniref:Uncharacterized protein n=1 Tax=Fusarium keratoplasticum TaxID=1328300 RepID=A0ACC0QRS4_9HYPO|nr:hypothetical protein NCS57_00930500 [Fusarium keratoplasticum]KAI8663299.1 hypothetical protein NCS57_00930500 [Fusarium keratoplasticum]